MKKRLSAAAVPALKEALASIYWYKSDLKSFLQTALGQNEFLRTINWGDTYKWQIASDVVDYFVSHQETHLELLTRLCHEIVNIVSFDHLEKLDGGKQKAEKARRAVEVLKKLVDPHDEVKKEEAEFAERLKRHSEIMKKNSAVRQRLVLLKEQYSKLVISTDYQNRGYELEKLMYNIFELFDLDPKASFKLIGEQIDGAFALEGTDFIFEAKWEASPIALPALDIFSSKVNRRLENTLGLFLSINGYSREAIEKLNNTHQNYILMDGADLLAVLEERIDFVNLILRKKQHASRTGEIYLPVHLIL